MVTATNEARSPEGDLAFSKMTTPPRKIVSTILKFAGLMLLDAFALILVYTFFYDGAGGLGLTIAVITIMANVFVMVPSLYPLKWMTPGLMLVTLLVIYPIILTVQTAFTNYGDGHLFIKERVIDLIASRGYVPDTATTYRWVPFRLSEREYGLWLVDNVGQTLFALPGQEPVPVSKADLGYSDELARYLFNPNNTTLLDTVANVTYRDIKVYSDGEAFGLWIVKDANTILYAFPDLPIAETPLRDRGQRIAQLADGLTITYGADNIPTTIGDFALVENLADEAQTLATLSLGVDEGDMLVAGDINSVVPSIIGYTRLSDWSALAGLEELRFSSPLNTVPFQEIDINRRYIYDPQQSLVNDQRSSGTGIDAFYDITVYSDGTDFALWMIRLGSTTPGQALLALPSGARIESLTIRDNLGRIPANLERDFGIILRQGSNGIPDRIGDFIRTTDLPSDETLIWGEQGGDIIEIGELDVNERFVIDLDQRIAIDRQFGFVFTSIEFYANDDDPNKIAVWLGNGTNRTRFPASYIGIPDRPTLVNTPSRVRPAGFIPSEFEGYTQLVTERERTDGTTFLQTVNWDYFGTEGDTIGVKDTETVGRPYILRYRFDAETQTFTDLREGKQYTAKDNCNPPADPICGFFVSPDGDQLNPGYRVNVGLYNFTRLVEDERLRGPLLDIFVWTVTFAFLSVLTTFTVGLFMALILNDPVVPARKLFRSLLIIPYAIPGVISILVWQGMLNQNLGIITNFWFDLTGVRIEWFTNPVLAKFAILLVNLWLGYPYMMLISSGALQAIPSEVYEAAAVDGANASQRFWRITLPLLLVTLGPLMIASFVFNFNNFLLIEALTAGNPPIPGSPVPAGYTDILISYTYRLAFGNDRGADYGYAAAITIVIFFIVAIVTLIQYRYTKVWEQVGENV